MHTAARTGAEVHFDWDDPATFEPAIHGASGVYVTIASGHGSRPNGDVLAVTGTRPVSFTEFAAETASAWKEK